MTDYEALCEILSQENWEEELSNRAIYIRWDGDYFILEYSQFASDFNDPVVRACRGIVFDKNKRCVCHPFDKFSYGEEAWEQPIDWSTARVMEKVDGSLMKVWFDRNKWHLSTNGTIDAYKTEVNDCGKTFGEIFEEVADCVGCFQEWCNEHFWRNFTYMFELTSPYNQVIVDYGKMPRIWLIGARNMVDHKEVCLNELHFNMRMPHFYNLRSKKACEALAKKMTKNEEGFVVCDANFNRVKIKSQGWLEVNRLINNHNISLKRMVNMMKDNMIDDFLAVTTTNNVEKVNKVKGAIQKVTSYYEYSYNVVEALFKALPVEEQTRKNWATLCQRRVDDNVARAYCFNRFDEPNIRVEDWFMQCPTSKIVEVLEMEVI